MAGRWPVQAQPSTQSMATAEGRQPAVVAYNLLSIGSTLAGIVRDVMATDVPAHQPFMDVRDLPPVVLLLT